MEARAVRKHIRSSPKKMRPVINLVRGKSVAQALNILHYQPHKATRSIELAIHSAVHNLMDRNPDERFDEGELLVRQISVGDGARFKRFQPAPRGRAHPILKRTCHLTVVVGTAGGEMEERE
ncbi:MAG: 50S ribosomal protein L22 [Rhodothermales bacterium]